MPWVHEPVRARAALVLPPDPALVLPPDPAVALRGRIERRVSRFRNSVVTAVILTPAFFVLGMAVHSAPVFFIPSAVLVLSVLWRAGRLWASDVGPITALRSNWRARLFGATAAAAMAAERPRTLVAGATHGGAAVRRDMADPQVMAGPFGQTLHRAAEDRAFIQDVLARLGTVEREMLPDVEPTADALMERVAALGTMLHRLDADVSGTTLAQLDKRIESLRTEPATRDRDRHLTLLERQRATLHDLLERRRTLENQLESASLLLQNLKFDLLKLRSAGIGAALSDVTSVTQEARALSRDIGHVLDAADDVRKL
jgi:serine/threonine-protein kinase